MYRMNAESRTKWQQYFEDFSYKPNWEFEFVYEIDYDDCKVIMTMRVPDSRRPLPEIEEMARRDVMGRRQVVPLVPITKTVRLEPWHSEKRAHDFIWFHIMDVETHEVGEWFKYKGELPFDPHKEKV